MDQLFENLGKLSIPLSILSALFAGSAWLTTLHNKVDDLSGSVKAMEIDHRTEMIRDSEQDSRLSRIEGKLDIVINHLSNWGPSEKKRHLNSHPDSH